MSRHTASIAALLFATALALGVAPGAARAQEHNDRPEDLPAGQGRDETFFTCAACHGIAIIVRQGLPRERWDATIDDMIRQHNMPPPDDADRRLIVDYLAATFPPRARGRRPANPFLNRP